MASLRKLIAHQHRIHRRIVESIFLHERKSEKKRNVFSKWEVVGKKSGIETAA